MDAKVGDWVVTPRRGKAVEINALWYNALRLMEGWYPQARRPRCRHRISEAAPAREASFNRRFWYEEGGYLYDVVDGRERKRREAAGRIRFFAFSLEHPVLDRERWEPVLDVVTQSIADSGGSAIARAGDPDYKPRY